MPKDLDFEIEDTEVRLSDAASHHCRWIVRHGGRGEFVICGRRVRLGSAYCEHHHIVVWRRSGEGRPQGSSREPETQG